MIYGTHLEQLMRPMFHHIDRRYRGLTDAQADSLIHIAGLRELLQPGGAVVNIGRPATPRRPGSGHVHEATPGTDYG